MELKNYDNRGELFLHKWRKRKFRKLPVQLAKIISNETSYELTAYRHRDTFDPGTAYLYKCDLLVSFMQHDVRCVVAQM